jgi:hypothetical protein
MQRPAAKIFLTSILFLPKLIQVGVTKLRTTSGVATDRRLSLPSGFFYVLCAYLMRNTKDLPERFRQVALLGKPPVFLVRDTGRLHGRRLLSATSLQFPGLNECSGE